VDRAARERGDARLVRHRAPCGNHLRGAGRLERRQILGRTRGNAAWFAFYSLFVLAATVHAPIGLRAILLEWLGWRGRSRGWFLLVVTALLAWMGMRAVFAVFT
jgi:fumarate reductase subunit C